MPKDYRLEKTPANQQRRPQYARDDAWTRAFLLRAQVAYVATHWDEQPFLTPTLYWYDPGQQKIFFHSNRLGRLRANSERHAQVCLAVSEFGKLLPSKLTAGAEKKTGPTKRFREMSGPHCQRNFSAGGRKTIPEMKQWKAGNTEASFLALPRNTETSFGNEKVHTYGHLREIAL